jgi:threonine aldolase
MREEMAGARLGDDVYGEDPTVNALEQIAAEKVGKEAGLFVSSGTMGNLVGILSHANRGDEAIVGLDAHTNRSEAGSMATIGGIVPRPLPTDEAGRMDLSEMELAIRPDNPHFPRSRLILVENSYGAKYGYPIPTDYFANVKTIARRYGLSVHLDGARLFNAAIALNIDARELTQHVDSVSFCLSKGLCAPVGSLLCGSGAFIHQARRMRKSLGGGMRQAGVLAAAGIVAVNEMVERLADDHEHAKMLANGLAQIPGIAVEPDMVKTNMVFFGLCEHVDALSRRQVTDQLRESAGIWLGVSGSNRFRAVTHYWIGPSEVEIFLDALSAIMRQA